jgi:hypothetical protein
LSGGNGDGTATGVHAQATINGQTLTADVNDFAFSDALGSYTFSVAPGFLGVLDSISVSSTETDYAIQGGNGDGTAIGADASVVINGRTFAGNQGHYTYESDTGSYSFEFIPGFSGSFGPIRVSSSSGASLQIAGGDGQGTAHGTDPIPIVASGDGRPAASVRLSVFERLRYATTLTLGLDAATLGGSAGKLQRLATGGSASGLDGDADHAVRIAKQALAYVSNIESLLERAALPGDQLASKLPAISAADALRTALDFRNTVKGTGVVPFRRSSLDPRLALDLLSATPR